MSNRDSLLFGVVVANLAIKLFDGLGEETFYFVLVGVLMIWLVWTIADYRHGKPVFIWQKRNGRS